MMANCKLGGTHIADVGRKPDRLAAADRRGLQIIVAD
jgi:hypothetical protein